MDELLQALKDIQDALDADDENSWRNDDPDGAMDYAFQKAANAVSKAER